MSINKIEEDFLLRQFFLKLSVSTNKTCSEKCGIDTFEKHLTKVSNNSSLNILELNYQGALDCYEKCLSKFYQSSFLGVGLLQNKFN